MLMKREKKRKAMVKVNAAGNLPIFAFRLNCNSMNSVLPSTGSHVLGFFWSTLISIGLN